MVAVLLVFNIVKVEVAVVGSDGRISNTENMK